MKKLLMTLFILLVCGFGIIGIIQSGDPDEVIDAEKSTMTTESEARHMPFK